METEINLKLLLEALGFTDIEESTNFSYNDYENENVKYDATLEHNRYTGIRIHDKVLRRGEHDDMEHDDIERNDYHRSPSYRFRHELNTQGLELDMMLNFKSIFTFDAWKIIKFEVDLEFYNEDGSYFKTEKILVPVGDDGTPTEYIKENRPYKDKFCKYKTRIGKCYASGLIKPDLTLILEE